MTLLKLTAGLHGHLSFEGILASLISWVGRFVSEAKALFFLWAVRHG